MALNDPVDIADAEQKTRVRMEKNKKLRGLQVPSMLAIGTVARFLDISANTANKLVDEGHWGDPVRYTNAPNAPRYVEAKRVHEWLQERLKATKHERAAIKAQVRKMVGL